MCPSADARWFAHSDRAEDQDAVAGFGEPEAGEVRDERSVVGEVVGFVPGVQTHGGVQACGAGAEHG